MKRYRKRYNDFELQKELGRKRAAIKKRIKKNREMMDRVSPILQKMDMLIEVVPNLLERAYGDVEDYNFNSAKAILARISNMCNSVIGKFKFRDSLSPWSALFLNLRKHGRGLGSKFNQMVDRAEMAAIRNNGNMNNELRDIFDMNQRFARTSPKNAMLAEQITRDLKDIKHTSNSMKNSPFKNLSNTEEVQKNLMNPKYVWDI